MKPDTMKSSARKIRFAALMGFLVGVLGGAAYLLSGGICFFDVPLWSSIVFYPGFIAGYLAWHLGEGVAKVIGVLVVGLVYALIAALARWIWITVKRRNHFQNDSPNPSQP
jgi:hypothetical protein